MELYHVMNRGVDGRTIFLDNQDRARFVHDLYEFNDIAPALEFSRATSRVSNVGRTTSYIRERIVDIHGWELMKNHYHLLLSERSEGGMTLFLRKLSGYARYFNERHKRRGVLFQGRTKKILIARQEHFLYILHYIHLNSLDYLPGAKKWRERDKGSISDIRKVLEYLKTYRWSSYLDYCGTKNFPSILTKSLFSDSLGKSYSSALKEYLSDKTTENLAEEIDLKYLEY
jgi:putative transposase